MPKIFYAVKANPAGEIVAHLSNLGSSFDVASRNEIELCLDRGVGPERLSFGNTIKKERDIAFAYEQGVRLFAFDSAPELEKLARAAPGARVFCRILIECSGAEWPLSRKFGCAPEMAVELLRRARELWPRPLWRLLPCRLAADRSRRNGTAPSAKRRGMFSLLAEADINLRMVNIGGGFPARYRGRRASRWSAMPRR